MSHDNGGRVTPPGASTLIISLGVVSNEGGHPTRASNTREFYSGAKGVFRYALIWWHELRMASPVSTPGIS